MATRGKKEAEPQAAEGARDEATDAGSGDSASTATPDKRARARGSSPDSAGPARWADGLSDVVPGFTVLDRELVLDGARADLVGVDPSGRLHLVQLADEDPDRAALRALDAVRMLRTNLDILARHVGEGRVDPERSPRVLVVSTTADDGLAARLEPMRDAGVLVLGLRTVKSAAGTRSYLTRLDDEAVPGAREGVAAFLRSLPSRLEPLGAALMERMDRLDEELTPTGDSTTLAWRLGDEVLCRVERVGDLLQASVAPRHQPMPLGDMNDLEVLVEAALGRLVRVLGLTRGGDAVEERPPRPGADEPILTREELEAFRE